MTLSRNTTLKIANILDNWVPPIIRNSKYFIYLPFKLMFKDKAKTFLTFKQKAPFMTEKDYVKLYKDIDTYLIQRETSLNSECEKEILKSIKGQTVLEAGCGNAYLAKKLSEKYHVTGADILVENDVQKKNGKIRFVNANIEHLPFKNKEFDTTVCTHTLEHVQKFERAVTELRRVTKKRLIIVVPMQKASRYTFDLHIRFFPFTESFLLALQGVDNIPTKHICKDVGGDIFYYEDINK